MTYVERIVTADMPRLTTLDYLNHRAALRKEWLENDGYAFAFLTPTQQFHLHDYYAFTKELAPLDVLEHRKRVSAGKSSLPQQAGRVFTRIRPFLDLQIIPQAPRAKSDRKRTWIAGKRRVKVFSLVKPVLDPEQFARILIAAAKQGPPPGYVPMSERRVFKEKLRKNAFRGVAYELDSKPDERLEP